MPTVNSSPIVESNSNDNGSYVKFADGTLICRGTTEGTGSAGYNTHTLPYPMIDTNYVVLVTYREVTSSTQISYRAMSVNSYTTTNFETFKANAQSWLAVGRWK